MTPDKRNALPIWAAGIEGQVALVTGAGRGLGRACALALSHAGALVIGVADALAFDEAPEGHRPAVTPVRNCAQNSDWETQSIPINPASCARRRCESDRDPSYRRHSPTGDMRNKELSNCETPRVRVARHRFP